MLMVFHMGRLQEIFSVTLYYAMILNVTVGTHMPDTPLRYCRGGKKLVLLESTTPSMETYYNIIVVMKNPDHDLQRYVITFQ